MIVSRHCVYFGLLICVLSGCVHQTQDKQQANQAVKDKLSAKLQEKLDQKTSQRTAPDEQAITLAASIGPTNPKAVSDAGDFYRNRFLADKRSSDANKAIEYYQQFLQLQPEHLNTQIVLYDLYYKLHFNNQVNDFERLSTQYNRLPEQHRVYINAPETAEAYRILITNKKSKQENYQQSKLLAVKGLQRAPRSSGAYILLSNILSDEKRYAAVISLLEQGLKYFPNNALFMEYIGNAHHDMAYQQSCEFEDQQSWQRAVTYYTQAKQTKPDNTDIRFNLVQSYFSLNQRQQALDEAKQLYQLNSSKNSLIDVIEGYLAIGDFSTAYEFMEQKKQQYSSTFSPRVYAEYLMRMGKWEQALTHYQQHTFSSDNTNNLYSSLQATMVAQVVGSSWRPETNLKASANNGWQKVLLNYWQGKINSHTLLNTAKDRCEQLEANTYIGYRYWQQQQYDEAKYYLTAATNTGIPLFVEDAIATQLLHSIPQ